MQGQQLCLLRIILLVGGGFLWSRTRFHTRSPSNILTDTWTRLSLAIVVRVSMQDVHSLEETSTLKHKIPSRFLCPMIWAQPPVEEEQNPSIQLKDTSRSQIIDGHWWPESIEADQTSANACTDSLIDWYATPQLTNTFQSY